MALQQETYRDNLDVEMLIDGAEWRLVEARVELSKATTPDFVDMKLMPTREAAQSLPQNPTLTIDEGGLVGADFTLDVDNTLASTRPSGSEKTRLFTGKLGNLSKAADGSYEGTAYNPLHEIFSEEWSGSFFNTIVRIEHSLQKFEFTQPDGNLDPTNYANESPPRAEAYKISASELLQQIFDAAQIDTGKINIHLSEEGTSLAGSEPVGRDTQLYVTEDFINVSDMFRRIKRATNSEWWFDRDGEFHFGVPRPGNPVEGHLLNFITDTSAGITTPKYNSVRVIGDGIVSEDGWRRSSLRNSTAIKVEGNIADDEQDEELAPPTFVYRNMSIKTQEEANSVRSNIIQKLREQQKGGSITVLGMPEVRPMDTVQMPDSETQPMGGESYGVTKVIHKLNGSDGFLTEITVTGLRPEHEVLYEDDVREAVVEMTKDNETIVGLDPNLR